MKSFTILRTGSSAKAKSEFEVHLTGCRDIARSSRRDQFVDASRPPIDATTAEHLVADEVATYTYQQQGWTADDHRIMPCAHTTVSPPSSVSEVIVHLKDGTYKKVEPFDGYTVIVHPDGTVITNPEGN
jgi:hypothetical protein